MNNKFFIILFILIKLLFGQNQSYYCDKYNECENCTFCHENNTDYCSCNFNNGYCIYGEGVYFSKEFLNHYDGCIKDNGNYTNICGDSDIELIDGEKNIIISSTSSSNIVCYYNFIYLGSDNKNISIRLQRSNIIYPKFYLFLMNYIDDEIIVHTYQTFNTTNYELINIKAKKLSLYIDLLQPYFSDGLLLTFSIINNPVNNSGPKKGSKKKITIIISIICVVIVLVITVIITILIKSKNKNNIKNNNNINNESNENTYNTNESLTTNNIKDIEEVNKIEKNKNKIDNLFKKEMRYKIYNKKNYSKYLYCNICKEYFIDNSSVIVTTKCNHIFHLKCLKSNVYANIQNPKCPKCNYLFLGQEIENSLLKKSSNINVNEIETKIINI